MHLFCAMQSIDQIWLSSGETSQGWASVSWPTVGLSETKQEMEETKIDFM
jgi:hypothetical protein